MKTRQVLLLLGIVLFTSSTAFWASTRTVFGSTSEESSTTHSSASSEAEALAPRVADAESAPAPKIDAQQLAIANNSVATEATTEAKAYHYFQTKQYVAALQTFSSARLENAEATFFLGDVAEFCGTKTPDQAALDRQVQYLRRKITPITAHKVWVAIKAHEICRNYQGSPILEHGMLAFKILNDLRNTELGPTPPLERWRAWKDDHVVRANTVGQLWMLANGSFAGAVGADYFGIEPTRRTNDPQRSASLSRAQTVAIMRLRCDMTHACGPEQLDSLLVCARYFQCRPGISVEEVWRSVASPYELQAAQAIYQQYVAMRSARRK